MKRDALVKYWFDTGARGYEWTYGIVIASGAKTFTVRWESGIQNRLPMDTPIVKPVVGDEEIAEAKKALHL